MSSSPANMVHSEGEMCQDCHTLDPLADFVDAAQQHIQSRIRVSSEGFCFRTPRNVFSSPQFQQFLDQGHERNPILRYIYYPDKHLLKIIPTGNRVQQAFDSTLAHNVHKFESSGVGSKMLSDALRIGRGRKPVSRLVV